MLTLTEQNREKFKIFFKRPLLGMEGLKFAAGVGRPFEEYEDHVSRLHLENIGAVPEQASNEVRKKFATCPEKLGTELLFFVLSYIRATSLLLNFGALPVFRYGIVIPISLGGALSGMVCGCCTDKTTGLQFNKEKNEFEGEHCKERVKNMAFAIRNSIFVQSVDVIEANIRADYDVHDWLKVSKNWSEKALRIKVELFWGRRQNVKPIATLFAAHFEFNVADVKCMKAYFDLLEKKTGCGPFTMDEVTDSQDKVLRHTALCGDVSDLGEETDDTKSRRAAIKEVVKENQVNCEGCNLVSLKQLLKRCGKCKTAYYCSEQCQKKCWVEHKYTCRPLCK